MFGMEINDLIELYKEYELSATLAIMLILMIPFRYVAYLCVDVLLRKFIESKSSTYAKIFTKKKIYQRIVTILFLAYLIFFSEHIDQIPNVKRFVIKIKDILIQIYTIIVVMSVLNSIINVLVSVYNSKMPQTKVPVSLYAQIFRIIVTICAVLAIISTVLGISIASLFTSLGAAAALLTLLFKDTLTSLVASLQVTFQDVIRVGDWVTLPNKNVDGTVQKITITIVVIQNFDGTTTTVPTAAFLDGAVRNWRPMYEAGGRRIKRSISLDMDYISVCDKKMLDQIKSIPLLKNDNNKELFDSSNETTNATLFRYYTNAYLAEHQGIHKDGFTFLVRQLDPTPTGLPIELYIFANETDWNKYETIQASIFEHLIGILPKFGLKPFQTVVKMKE